MRKTIFTTLILFLIVQVGFSQKQTDNIKDIKFPYEKDSASDFENNFNTNQNSELTQKIEPTKRTLTRLTILDKKNSIIFSPLDLLNPINPSLKFGYQRFIGNKYEIQFEYGYIINKALFHYLINLDEDKDEYSNQGTKLRIEFKRYVRVDNYFRFYYSGELFYLDNISKIQNQFIVSDPNFEYSFDLPDDGGEYGYTDYFTNSKIQYGVNVKVGVKLIVDPLFLEANTGLGVAYRNNIHTDRENINDKPYDMSLLNDNIPKKMLIPSLPILFKIGFMF